ncbi:non-ribosomal peptide synthetase, partial [Rheinheimera soli]
MNLSELFKALASKSIKLTLEGGSLNINAPKGAMTQEILIGLKEHKAKLIDYLQRSVIQENAIKPVKADGFIPLSHAQQSLWLLNHIEQASSHYNDAFSLTLTGELDKQAMDKAFSTIFERHESLRTSFLLGENNLPYQFIHEAKHYQVPVTDVSDIKGAAQAEKVAQLTKAEAAQCFDLSCDLLLRTCLVQRSHDSFTLLVTLHHIASDGWSIGVLISEFCALYSAYVKGDENPLAPLPIQYSDYAYWQRQWVAGPEYQKQLGYWRKQLEGAPALHNLQLDFPRGPQQTFDGATHVSTLDSEVFKKLIALCKDTGASVFMGIHAAFSAFIARYSNETDIVVGTPIANRSQQELEGLIGFFINILVLRADLSERPSFYELLKQSKSLLLDAYARSQVPFEKVVEEVQPVRSLNHTPLFQILLVFNNEGESNFELPGLTLCTTEQYHDFAKYDLTLNILESKHGLSFRWQYNCALLSEATIAKMGQHFNMLITSLVSSPQTDVFKANMLLAGESEQLVDLYNRTSVTYQSISSVHSMFEQKVAENGESIAIILGEQSLSYTQLNEKANMLAAYLTTHQGVAQGSLVGIFLDRSVEMVISVLAVLKAGGAYVPMDPLYPQSRIAYIVQDASPKAIISRMSVAEKLPSKDGVVCLDDESVISQLTQIKAIALPQVTPTDLAYVIYTSGSTGQPKGVSVEHAQVLNYLEHARSQYFSQVTGAVVSSPLSFDATVTSLWGALVSGKSLYLFDSDPASELEALCELMGNIDTPTLFKVTPSHLEGIAQVYAHPTISEQCHLLVVGGEQLRTSLARKWVQKLLPNSILINEYGPTETVVGCSTYSVTAGNAIELNGLAVPVGLAVGNMQLYVLSDNLIPVGLGVPGELYIGGKSVARGYLNRPELTAERFINNPFYQRGDENSSERLYRSGDLVRWLPQGQLSYLGRLDSQIKLRGFRIETGEVEHALNNCDRVVDCVVLVQTLPSGHQGLVAYVVIDKLSEQEAGGIRDELKQQLAMLLPDYMMPSVFMLLKALPLTANGKLDTKALPALDMSVQQQQYAAPNTAIEQALCEIWQNVLGIDKVGIHDNFFELGGHSLLVMQVISGLQERNIVMEVRQLFASPRLYDLAKALDSQDVKDRFVAPENLISVDSQALTPQMLPLVELSQQEIDVICSRVPGGVGNIQDIYPLGSLQQGIFFHHMMIHDGGDPYVMPLLFKVRDKDVLDNFLQAMTFIVDRHDILRTAIVFESLTEAVQVVLREVKLPIEWLQTPQGKDPLAYMQAMCAPELQHMALDKAPLLSIKVMPVVQTGQYLLLVQFHHMVSDHVGLDIIQRELTAFELGQTEFLAVPMPYREFIAHTLHRAREHDAFAYFKQNLGDVKHSSLPFGLINVQGDGSQINELKEAVPAAVCAQLRQVARRSGLFPAAIFHAAWGILIGGFSGQQDVVFGTVVSGRLQGTTGAVNTVGVFMNTLPFRVKLHNTSVTELLAQVTFSLTELLPYEQASLAAAQRAATIADDAPLFSSMLNYRHSAVGDLEDLGNSDSKVVLIAGQERSNYPFCLLVDDLAKGFEISVQLDSAVDAVQVMQCTQALIAKLSEALLHSPEMPLSDLLAGPAAVYQRFLADQRYYAELLGNAPKQQLPGATGSSADKSAKVCTQVLTEVAPDEMAALAQGLDVPVLAVWLAVHFCVLAQLSGQSNALSCVAAGDELFVLSAGVSQQSWVGLIAEVAAKLATRQQYGRYPIAAIARQQGQFLQEVLFSLDGTEVAQGYQFQVDVRQEAAGVVLSLRDARGSYDAVQLAQMAGYYTKAVALCLADVSASHAVSLLDDEALTDLTALEKGEEHGEEPAFLLEQFISQAQAHPEHLAVREGELSLSYQALLSRVQRLGHYLRSLDIGPGSRVGIYLPRGIAQVVAVLGVHYAGASYVALELSHPRARLAYQVKDSDTELLLLSKAQSGSELS